MGGKKARKNFYQKHTYIASKKRWKKSLEKVRKHVFFIKHEYRDQKMGGKNARKIFPETHVNREL